MPQTADNLARDFEIKREEADKFALRSQQRYGIARGEGFFSGEISPVELPPTRKGPQPPVAEDEHPRPNTDLDTLGRMKALYEGGVTTAGNASGVNDGAVAMILASQAAGEKAGAKRSPGLASAAMGATALRASVRGGFEKGARARGAHYQGHGCHRNQRGVRARGCSLPKGIEVTSM